MSTWSTAVLGESAPRTQSLAVPRGDVFTPPRPERQLPSRAAPVAVGYRPAWLFVAAHGGSGAGLLARLSWQPRERVLGAEATAEDYLPYAISSGRAWPDPAVESTGMVVVVCRTTMSGLAWARDVAAQYLSDRVPIGVRVLGVVTVADQPGRPPRPIESARSLLIGAYANCWHIPYVPEYRLFSGLPGADCPPIHPAVEDVLGAIRSTLPKGLN